MTQTDSSGGWNLLIYYFQLVILAKARTSSLSTITVILAEAETLHPQNATCHSREGENLHAPNNHMSFPRKRELPIPKTLTAITAKARILAPNNHCHSRGSGNNH